MGRIWIRGGHVIDPSQGWDEPHDLLIENGRVTACRADDLLADDEVFDASGMLVMPGWIDLGAELREPGFEEDETIATGTAAAVAGGFTCVACLPNSEPPIDTQASVEFVRHQAERAGHCNVAVLACISKDRAGRELAEMGLLAQAGAVGFSDAASSIANPDLMRRALEYSQMFNLPVINRPESLELTRDGVMHEGWMSTLLGLAGMPAEAEDVVTARDIRLAEATGGLLHLLQVSTTGSVELVKRAKQRGVRVSASIPVANLTMTDEALRSFDANCKVNPPLRSQEHVQACRAALKDGTLDAICSGHAPRAAEKKMDVLDGAPYGMVALETTLGLIGAELVRTGVLTWADVVQKLSCGPAKILGLTQKGSLREGSDADITIVDPVLSWTVEPRTFYSKSANTPLTGRTLQGRAVAVMVGGRWRYHLPRTA